MVHEYQFFPLLHSSSPAPMVYDYLSDLAFSNLAGVRLAPPSLIFCPDSDADGVRVSVLVSFNLVPLSDADGVRISIAGPRRGDAPATLGAVSIVLAPVWGWGRESNQTSECKFRKHSKFALEPPIHQNQLSYSNPSVPLSKLVNRGE